MKRNENNPLADPDDVMPDYTLYASADDIYNHFEKEEFREVEKQHPNEKDDDEWEEEIPGIQELINPNPGFDDEQEDWEEE